MKENNVSKEEMFAFAEWAGVSYIRMAGFWVNRYSNQSDKKNWIKTEDLFEFYKTIKKA
ncbi:MAG: hypothetical protein ACOC1K_05880 [Nanoarchaeota archaeon]